MQEENKQNKTSKQKIKGWILFFAILLAVYALLFAIFNFVPYFKNKEKFIVVSDSMEPIIAVGDLIIVNKAYEEDDLQVNTIIAFYEDLNNDGEDEIVVHYIAQVNNDGVTPATYKTKRYNVQSFVDWDDWELTKDDIIGTYYTNLKKMGSILLFVESPFGKFVVLIDLIVIFLLIETFAKEDENKKKKSTIKK
jgi:signal peptidase I